MKGKGRYRKGVFLVVYAREKAGKKESEAKYLLLHRILHWKGWEFPKGGIEKGESALRAAGREFKEETGLKPSKIINMHIKGKFNYPHELKDRRGIKGMAWSLFAIKTKKAKVRIDKLEHDNYRWLSFKDAYKKLKFGDKKRCLMIVGKYLKTAKYAK